MKLSDNVVNGLSEILTKIKAGNETSADRAKLIKILEYATPQEMELFVQRHGIASVDALKRHIDQRNNEDLVKGLAIMGAALVTAHLLSR